MTYTTTAISKAIEAGFDNRYLWFTVEKNPKMVANTSHDIAMVLLDPAFWQCLGKSMGWEEKGRITVYQYDGVSEQPISISWSELDMWRIEMHRLIDYLANGGDIESFFAELLGNEK